MLDPSLAIVVRPATTADRSFVLATVPRLGDFAVPEWRTAPEIAEGDARALRAYFDAGERSDRLQVAESKDGRRLGFVYLETVHDYFTGEEHGHVSVVAVESTAEGRGVGTALLEAADAWACGRGYRTMTLNVFATNDRARRLYERLGYVPETVRYRKDVGAA
jgi:ribosomal protein S18 acetylase RimI-like enzyme